LQPNNTKKHKKPKTLPNFEEELQHVLNVYKPVSKTPLEMVQLLKSKLALYRTDPENPSKSLKIGYAGRLDPMAHGVLLLLVGDENKKRKNYEFYQKKYTFQIVLGFETDTHDILGLVTSSPVCHMPDLTETDDLRNCISEIIATQFIGKHDQKYPAYSSARVKGKPLFQWAKENQLENLEIPSKNIEIFSINVLSMSTITTTDLIQHIHERINGISSSNSGKFRQPEILQKWQEVSAQNPPDQKMVTLTLEAHVSHGTYIRSIAQLLGLCVGTGAVVIDLLRNCVGEFLLEDSIKL